MNRVAAAALILLAVSISGCNSGLDTRYLDASLGAPLELPPDLIGPERESAYDLPDSMSVDKNAPAGERPVLARVESVELQSSGNLYWLSVEEPVDKLYRLVKNFWSSEGYGLVVDEPAIGIMQTEWVYKEEGTNDKPDNWFLRLFDSADLTATQDQFRTRIERGQEGENRVYITHRGTEYKYTLERDDRGQTVVDDQEEETDWRHRQPDHELEVEMLSRLMLYLGLQKAEVDQQLAAAKLYAPRAFLGIEGEENSPFLIIRDPYQIAWHRIQHHLEQLNFEIASSQYQSGLSGEGVFIVNTEVGDNSEEDTGFFTNLFSSREIEGRQFTLVVSEETHELTRVELETVKGELDSSPEGAQFLKLLYRQIR